MKPIETARLVLTLETSAQVLARIEAMPPGHRAQVSPAWLEQMRSQSPTPWTHGFAVAERSSGAAIGSVAFKGPPDEVGVVEIAYAIEPDHRRQGYAREAAAALTRFAFEQGVKEVRAHTLPEDNASTRVLEACGFEKVGDVVDLEDGPVWRWRRQR